PNLPMRDPCPLDDAPNLEAARAYAARGWPVLPLKGKVPITKHGVKDATTDHATISAWWEASPESSICIATGQTTCLLLLDVAPRSAGDESLATLLKDHPELERPCVAESGGGGAHFYSRNPGGGRYATQLAPGIDVKSDAGYVVAPPSLHASGARYRWLRIP